MFVKFKQLIKNIIRGIYRLLYCWPVKLIPETDLVVSFVHGYDVDSNSDLSIHKPALWRLGKNGSSEVFKYPFPLTIEDFHDLPCPLVGELPDKDTPPLEKLPRYGFMGITIKDEYLYASAWNAIYKISKDDFKLDSLISNHLLAYSHGLACDENYIYTCLTGKDAIVLTSYEGKIAEAFCINPDLTISPVGEDIDNTDWRFVSKKRQGAAGYFHFNYIQKYGNELFLTSRNINSFVVVDLINKTCRLLPLALSSPAMVHDGILYKGEYYFTSIDGQIIRMNSNQDDTDNPYHSNLHLQVSRLVPKPNWQRGLEIYNDTLFTTVDGRYGAGRPFAVQAMTLDGKYLAERRFNYKEASFPVTPGYVTGFDVHILS